MKNHTNNLLLAALLATALSACGGGGSSNSSSNNSGSVEITPTPPISVPVVVEPPPTNVNIPTTPVVTTPPVTLPPVTTPPVTQPTNPPVITLPPVINPPVTQPPVITLPPVTQPPVTQPPVITLPPVVQPPVTQPPVSPTVYFTQQQASRFLTRSTFGPKISEIQALTTTNPGAWIDSQSVIPMSLHQKNVEIYISKLPAGAKPDQALFSNSFYTIAVAGQDQLRQRVAFALSEIFVISFIDDTIYNNVRGAASYYDVLAKNSLGNFRQLLEDVTYHPMMGHYLTYIRNMKADGTGRQPDENYAREIMQLFTIGVNQLNSDGSVKKDGSGKALESYSNDDVVGLARVFTGLSYYGPDISDSRFWGNNKDPDAMVKPMQMYNKFHSTEAKNFLGASAGGDGKASIKIALDTLFNHPNVGPFIGKQLIQRLVTSNPSSAYVSRVAAAFNNNGQGVRGDMKAVIKAVLLDPEALNDSSLQNPSFGKIKEPVLRMTSWMRSFNTTSVSGQYNVGLNDDSSYGINQSPLRSPSVFNFFRPGYIPPNTSLSSKGLVAPELQIVNEASSAGYVNYMLNSISYGVGCPSCSTKDIQSEYKNELTKVNNSADLVEYINLILTGGTLSDYKKKKITDLAESVKIPAYSTNADGTNNNSAVLAAQINRIKVVIYTIMATQDYIVQK